MLRPRPSPWLVARPRLTSRLNNGLTRPVTLVCAPAGSGKTSLLSEWGAAAPIPVAWLSLDESDDELAAFVDGVVAAVRSVFSEIGRATLSYLQASEGPSWAELATEFGNDLLALPNDLIVVIDDFHTVGNPEIHDFVAELLRYPPPRLHLAIGSRVDPALPLTRLRARGQLVEIRAADLGFTPDEAVAFLRLAIGANVDQDLAEMVCERNEGWIAGLQLAAIAVRNRPSSRSVRERLQSDRGRSAMAFMADEAITSLDEDIQRFIHHVAVPDRICPELCDALIEKRRPSIDCQELLARLESNGIFLTRLDEEGRWFRFHQLFRDLLLERLVARVGEDGRNRLHALASALFAEQGMIEDAIGHSRAAGDDARAAALVESHAQLTLARERWPELERWLALLHPGQVDSRPELLLASAWIHQRRGRLAAIPSLLARTRSVLSSWPDQSRVDEYGAEVDLLNLFTVVGDTHLDWYLTAAKRAMDVLAWDRRVAPSVALFLSAMARQLAGDGSATIQMLDEAKTGNQGDVDAFSIHRTIWAGIGLMFAHLYAGNLSDCAKAANDQVTLATRYGLDQRAALASAFLGAVCYERNDLNAAIAHFSIADACPGAGVVPAIGAAIGLALAYQAVGRDLDADEAITRLLDRLLVDESDDFVPTVRSFQARLASMRGNLAPALRWRRTTTARIDDQTMHATELAALTRAKILLAEGSSGSLATARVELERLRLRTEEVYAVRRRIEVLALISLVQAAQRRDEEALATLSQAVSFAPLSTSATRWPGS